MSISLIDNAKSLKDLFNIEEVMHSADASVRSVIEQNTEFDKDVAFAIINAIDNLYPDKPIKTIEEYRLGRAMQSYINGMWCRASNAHVGRPFQDMITNTLNRIQKRLISYTKRQQIKDKEIGLLARYACATQYYPAANIEVILKKLHEGGVLLKEAQHDGTLRFYVRGLRAKVGDNTFSIDRLGREHRQYVEVTVPQAFPVSLYGQLQPMAGDDKWYQSVPEMNDRDYHVTGFGDRKGSARAFPVQWHDVPTLLRKIGALG